MTTAIENRDHIMKHFGVVERVYVSNDTLNVLLSELGMVGDFFTYPNSRTYFDVAANAVIRKCKGCPKKVLIQYD
jgi:hypothetical protein